HCRSLTTNPTNQGGPLLISPRSPSARFQHLFRRRFAYFTSSKREACPDSDLKWRLKLRQRVGRDSGDRCAEIRVPYTKRQLGPSVVIECPSLVEDIEDFGDQGDTPCSGNLQVVGSLEVDLTLERRACSETVNRLDARGARRGRNLATTRVVGVGRQRRERLSRAQVEAEADAQTAIP